MSRPPLAWLDFAQSFDGEARQRERAAGQFGFRRHDGLMPGDPLQATLHVQDTAPQVEVAPFEPVSLFGRSPHETAQISHASSR